ncbi:MAG TPA: response regulator transcription factor [Bryobacteraceae bacterium]|jgi:CheY-like chemotaxis protein|nr:response regulator transcription factor [Bryobacteraceae bacterium]
MLIGTRPLRVAIVEDSPEFLSAIQSVLASEAPDAVITGTATSASEGIELLRESEPDLALLDLFLQRSTGIDLLRHLQTAGNGTPTVVMTNAPSDELRRLCFHFGARAFLDKADLLDWLPQQIAEAQQALAHA